MNLEYAKYIQFPLSDGTYIDYGVEGIVMLPSGERYTGWEKNEHHYTTAYHRQFVLPTLEELFHFGYDPDDFIIPPRYYKNFDISIQVPKKALFFVCNELGDENNPTLTYDEITSQIEEKRGITPFHKLYRYSHGCSRVINANGNGRKLLISGDSQMIPSVPILCCYYSEVVYLDNRNKRPVSWYWSDTEFDDVLVELNCNPLDKYLVRNLL